MIRPSRRRLLAIGFGLLSGCASSGHFSIAFQVPKNCHGFFILDREGPPSDKASYQIVVPMSGVCAGSVPKGASFTFLTSSDSDGKKVEYDESISGKRISDIDHDVRLMWLQEGQPGKMNFFLGTKKEFESEWNNGQFSVGLRKG